MTTQPTFIINLHSSERLDEFRSAVAGTSNVVAVSVNWTAFLLDGGVDAQYMSLT